jgi:transcriptional regulator with XRE-family HTH domain
MTNENTKTLSVENIGGNLLRLRKEHKLSREKFAELIDISSRIVYDYEDGFKTPSLDTLVRIANLYGVTLDDILRSA